MPQPFYICKTDSDLEKSNLEGNSQLSIVDDNGISFEEGEPLTTLSFSEKIRIENLNLLRVFDVHHDFKVSKKGYVFQKHFNYYLIQNNFRMYHDKRKKLLVLNAPKEVAIDFLKTLTETIPSFKYVPFEPDISKTATKIGNLKGAWLDVDKQDTQHQAYFGTSIDQDAEVKNGLKRKQVKFINFYYNYSSDSYYMGLSKDGNLVVYTSELIETEKIKLVFEVYNKLLK